MELVGFSGGCVFVFVVVVFVFVFVFLVTLSVCVFSPCKFFLSTAA